MFFDEQLYRKLLDNVQDGVYLVSREREILYWNRGAERISGFTAEEVTGKPCMSGILNHVDERGNNLCKTHCPLAKTLEDGKERHERIYLHHRDGHRVPVEICITPVHDEQGRIVGAAEAFRDLTHQEQMQRELARAREGGTACPLTELPSGQQLLGLLEGQWAELKTGRRSLALYLIELDNVQQINQAYGYDMGDLVIKMVARTLANVARQGAVLGRWRGSTFLYSLQDIRALDLEEEAERLRVLVESSSRKLSQGRLSATVSIAGLMATAERDVAETLKKAAQTTASCREAGGNRVAVVSL